MGLRVAVGKLNLNPLQLLYLISLNLSLRLSFCLATDAKNNHTAVVWPRNVKVEMPGDIVLGALMMVHERENDPITCGVVMPQGGIQALEAMIYTVNWVNQNQLLPHTKLGALILDDCDKDTYGLQQAVHFIKGSISNLEEIDDQTSTTCPCATVTQRPDTEDIRTRHITGVIAASSSVTSIQVANLLKLFRIPQVSFFSTSPELANQERFGNFFRTIPSDEYQVNAMVAIIKYFNWTYVSVVYEESSYGKVAFGLLEEKLSKQNVCIAAREKLPKDSDVAKHHKYVQVVKRLKEHIKAKVVVVYGSDQEVRGLMKAIKSERATGQFSWIGSDGWSSRALVYSQGADEPNGLEAQVRGVISVQPMANPIVGFRQYFSSLRVAQHNRVNPWFYEFWEKEFSCKFNNTKDYPFNWHNRNYSQLCTGNEHANHTFTYEPQLQFVSDAVLVFAYALRQLIMFNCEGENLTVDCVKNLYPSDLNNFDQTKRLDGVQLRNLIANVSFEGLARSKFQFTGNGGPPRYNIIHFRFNKTTGKNEWVKIGNFTSDGLKLNNSLVQFYLNDLWPDRAFPVSQCSPTCMPGNKTESLADGCCWICIPCAKGYYLSNKTTCSRCLQGTKSNLARTDCTPIPEDSVEMASLYGLVCLSVALLGTAATGAILIVFVTHNDTPVVKASGRELSYVILLGMAFSFAMTPLMLLRPTDVICGLQRFLSGFCFTVIYAAILTKTNRIARIFQHGKRSIRRPIFISPQSQLVICAAIVSVQLLIMATWLYTHPPVAQHFYPTEMDNQLACVEAVKYTYLVTYVYPICLCCICTVYAFQTRKIPEAFNESKFIGAAVYTTCIIWLAFVPIYCVVKDNTAIRVTSVCISTSLTAIVCQLCLFVPKVYVILWRPEKNVRTSMLNQQKSSSTSLGGSKSASGSQQQSNNQQQPRSESSMYNSDDTLLEPMHRTPLLGDMTECPTTTIATQTSWPTIVELNGTSTTYSTTLIRRLAEDVQL